MELVELLRRYKGSTVTLEFTDGEVIDADILHIDAEDNRDFTYDVRRVRVAGPNTDYSKRGAYATSLAMLKSVRPAPAEGRGVQEGTSQPSKE
jgi:hypothetical protein